MKRTNMILACAALANAMVLSSVAVDWQFTGATNRTAAASQSCAIYGEFDSRIPSTVFLTGRNMRSDDVGLFILFR